MSFDEIRIADLGVISSAVLELGPGLSVITGETGAGKTMLLIGLGLILGEKADPKTVRTGSQRAFVEARLELTDPQIVARVADAGGEMDDAELLISRTVVAQGRSRAFLGGRSVPQAVLAEIAEELVTVHGQSDQVRLRTSNRQRIALDEFAGAALHSQLRKYRESWNEYGRVEEELEKLREQRDLRVAEARLLHTALTEFSEAEITAGEEDALKQQIERLTHGEDLLAAAREAHDDLVGVDGVDDEAGATYRVERARSRLSAGAAHDQELEGFAKRAAEIGYLLADLGADLASYSSNIETDSGKLTAAHERLALITSLLRKQAVADSRELLAWAEKAQARFLELDGDDERLEQLVEIRAELEERVVLGASELTRMRRGAAEKLEELITAELQLLAMPEARVTIDIAEAERGPFGADAVNFLLTPHRGAPPRPLGQGASGGELSRVMLALEVALASKKTGHQHTFVFDEVDAGVGGQAAVEVGKRLAKLARTAQVLVVTHLPQVAAFADQHLVVTKSTVNQDAGATSVSRVVEEDRVTELARMMSGLSDSATAQQHAAELLALAAAND